MNKWDEENERKYERDYEREWNENTTDRELIYVVIKHLNLGITFHLQESEKDTV